MSKICSKCKIEKSVSEFYVNKSMAGGYNSKCKLCAVEYQNNYQIEYAKKNAKIFSDRANERNRLIYQATPSWSETDKIKELHLLRKELTKSTGIKHEVDHKVPIKSDIVCGLHVFANLQIITKSANVSKGNRIWLDMI